MVVDQRAAESELGHAAIEFGNCRFGVLQRKSSEALEPGRVFGHHLCQIVVGASGVFPCGSGAEVSLQPWNSQ